MKTKNNIDPANYVLALGLLATPAALLFLEGTLRIIIAIIGFLSIIIGIIFIKIDYADLNQKPNKPKTFEEAWSKKR